MILFGAILEICWALLAYSGWLAWGFDVGSAGTLLSTSKGHSHYARTRVVTLEAMTYAWPPVACAAHKKAPQAHDLPRLHAYSQTTGILVRRTMEVLCNQGPRQ